MRVRRRRKAAQSPVSPRSIAGGVAVLYLGDMRDALASLPDNSVDAVVTDPPYGLKFMAKRWDYEVPSIAQWRQVLRVLKPGGHLLGFGGSRTYHRVVVNIEDAGFEVRDCVMWLYGSGFPKSLDVSKAIDKAAGVTRETGPVDPARAGRLVNQRGEYATDAGWSAGGRKVTIDPPATDAAQQWQGWGTALKPAFEPIVLARKPLSGTIATNVQTWGTGALNIDACRVEGGRWPANVAHDGLTEEWARYFYCAKASKADRNEGCDALPNRSAGEVTGGRKEGSAGLSSPRAGAGRTSGSKNVCPTVKPMDLMRYLCRLITPPGGVILDPFMGSGSTGKGAAPEGFKFIGVEQGMMEFETAVARVTHAYENTGKRKRLRGRMLPSAYLPGQKDEPRGCKD